MTGVELDTLLARMPQIAEAVERFTSESIQAEVFRALVRAFDGSSDNGVKGVNEETADPAVSSADGVAAAVTRSANKLVARKSSTSTVKQSFSIDKDLDLVGGGSVSFKQFVEAKKPTSGPERCLIAVYWLTRLTISPVEATPECVYTCYKHVAWPVPTDLVNTIQKAGSEGWLNTKSRNDIKVVVGGENHVEHTMPAQPKKP